MGSSEIAGPFKAEEIFAPPDFGFESDIVDIVKVNPSVRQIHTKLACLMLNFPSTIINLITVIGFVKFC